MSTETREVWEKKQSEWLIIARQLVVHGPRPSLEAWSHVNLFIVNLLQ